MKAGSDYIGVGVGALIFNQEGKFLLTLRGPKAKNERGKWEIPGGAVDFGETFEQAIQREVFEELGIKIKVKELLQICDHIIPDEQQHWVSPTYICEIIEGTPTIKEPEKCSEIGWFSLEEAQKLPLSIVTQDDVDCLLERQKN
jgi:8-oxo-dGTP diphosphatase